MVLQNDFWRRVNLIWLDSIETFDWHFQVMLTRVECVFMNHELRIWQVMMSAEKWVLKWCQWCVMGSDVPVGMKNSLWDVMFRKG